MRIKRYYLCRLIFVLLLAGLTACGGGGSGTTNDAGTNNGSNNRNFPPNLDGIAEHRFVQVGDTVLLDTDGAVDPDGEITEYKWEQLAGYSVDLKLSNDGYVFAPPNSENSFPYAIEFMLTATDNNLSSSSKKVTVCVVPAPVVDAGESSTHKGTSPIYLNGYLENTVNDFGAIEACFEDDSVWVKEYSWAQVGGPEVTIESADSLQASFSPPESNSPLEFEFELTATNRFGIKGSDVVRVEVVHKDAPAVRIAFPPAISAFTGSDIDVFGYTDLECLQWVFEPDGNFYCGTFNSLVSVTVDAGLGPINAAISGRNWRTENLPVPDDVAEFSITVEATDAAGRSRIATSRVLTDDTFVGEGLPLESPVALVVDAFDRYRDPDVWGLGFGEAFVLTKSVSNGEIKLIEIDLSTAGRNTFHDFSDETLGPMLVEPGDMVSNYEGGTFYISSKSPGPVGVMAVSITQRSMLSGAGVGEGVAFQSPHGLHRTIEDTILVADTAADAVLSVDLDSGNRTVLANDNTGSPGVKSPLYVAWNDSNDTIMISGDLPDDPYVYSVDLSDDPVTGSILYQNSVADGPDLTVESQGVYWSPWWGREFPLFILDGGSDRILGISSSGEGAVIADNLTGSTTSFSPMANRKAFDVVDSDHTPVFYVVGSDGVSERYTLYAIDRISGDKVVVSR